MRCASLAAAVTVLGLWGPCWGQSRPAAEGLQAGDAVALAGRKAKVLRLEQLPLVENDFSRRCVYDRFDNPKLKELRDRYALEALVAGEGEEFAKQLRLMDWVYRQFAAFGNPGEIVRERDARKILQYAAQKRPMFCSHMAAAFVSSAASVGWVDRTLALKRPDARGEGSTEHTTTEIWSNQYRKWVMLDPTHNQYMEKGGVPLSAFEIRQEWYYNDGNDLAIVMGKDGRWLRHTKKDLPIFERTMIEFGKMEYQANSLHKYAILGWLPSTDLMDRGIVYEGSVYYEDKFCEGTAWHRKTFALVSPEVPYFPLQQAHLGLGPQGADLAVTIRTNTPNFKEFQVRQDGGPWRASPASFAWKLRAGKNTLEARSVNQFGVAGAVSTAEVGSQ